MERDLFFSKLFAFCKEQTDDTESTETQDDKTQTDNYIDIQLVWSSIFDIAKKDPIHLPFFFPLLKQYSIAVFEFQNYQSEEIQASVQKASDSSLTLDERFENLKPLIYLISILPLQINLIIFKLIIDIVFLQLSKNQKEKTLSILENTVCSSINDEILESYIDIVESFIDTEKVAASLFVLAYFSKFIIEILPETCSKICSWIMNNITSPQPQNKIAALFLLKHASQSFSFNPKAVPMNDIFSLMLPLLVDKDPSIQKAANKATKYLISSQICYTKEAITALLSQYSSYSHDQLPSFFSLLHRFLDNNESPQLLIIQRIFDFTITSLTASKDEFVLSSCVELLSEISSISFEYIQESIDLGFETCLKLFSNKQYFTDISNFLMSLSENMPNYKSDIIEEKLPILIDSIFDEESGSSKKRLERAESLSTLLISRKNTNQEYMNKIINFAIDSINNGDIIYICALIIALSKHLEQDKAVLIFQQLESIVRTETNPTELNSVLHTMKKLMKLYSIDAYDFVLDILNGKIKYFDGLPVYTVQDPNTMIFLFVAKYVHQFPPKSGEICSKLIEFVPNISYALLPSILEPLEAGISHNVISSQNLAQLSSLVLDTLDKLLLDDEMEVIACIEILREINLSPNSGVLDHAKTISILKRLLESSQGEQEPHELPLESTISYFIFELTLKLNNDNEIDQELILNILKKLPLPPGYRYNQEIMSILVDQFIPNNEKYSFMTFQGLLTITELLISQNLPQYEFPVEIINKMKAILKNQMKEDKTLERQISKTFQTSRPKQNRFAKLLKNL